MFKCSQRCYNLRLMSTRALLLAELEWISGNCQRLIRMVKPEHLDYRPFPEMRSLLELLNHLAQIPAIDLLILRGAAEGEVQKAEQAWFRNTPDEAADALRQGSLALREYIDKLSLDQFENESGTAFYGRTQTNAKWLLEIVTHLYHHRAQLHMYLKLNGYPVNTRTLYG
jgi:uncharacterized damage-inducible protein DinB